MFNNFNFILETINVYRKKILNYNKDIGILYTYSKFLFYTYYSYYSNIVSQYNNNNSLSAVSIKI